MSIGTTVYASASGMATQVRMFVAAGRLWSIYCDGGDYGYASSDDDGATWTSMAGLDAIGLSGASLAWMFDGTYVHTVWGHEGTDLYYRRGTPASDGAITWTAIATLGLAATSCRLHSMDLDSSGNILISYLKDSQVYVGKSTNTSGGWTNASGYPKAITSTAGDYWSRVAALGANWYCTYGLANDYVRGRYWNGSILAASEAISSQTLQARHRFSASQYGGVLEVAWNSSSGIYSRRRSAAGVWGSVLTCAPGVDATLAPLIVATEVRTYCLYINSGSLYYRTSIAGAAWSAATSLGSATFPAPDMLAASEGADGGKVRIQTTRGASPYTVEYTSITVGTPPTAAFTRSPASGTAPLTVTVTDTSTGTPTAWDWNWGDGSAHSTTQNASHTYTAAGTFTITLTASNAGGSSTATASVTVSAAAPPLASFTRTPTSGMEPLTVQFTDASTGGAVASWDWDFGDGSAHSTAQNPSHTFAAGSWTVLLTVSNSGGSSQASSGVSVTAQPAPVANFTFAPNGGTAPATISFTNTSTGGTPTSLVWDFGDGTSSTEAAPSHEYLFAGTFAATLTLTNSGGTDAETKNVVISAPSGGMAATMDWRGPTSCSIHRCYGADKFLRPPGVTAVPYYDDLRTVAGGGTAPTLAVADSSHLTYGYLSVSGLAGKGYLLFQDRPGGNPADACVEALLRHVQSASTADQTAFLIFRFTDPSNHYYVRLNTNRTLELRKMVGGVQTQLALVSVPSVDPTTIYRLRVKTDGTAIGVFLNETQYMAVTDSSHSGGACGLAFSYCKAEAHQLVWYDEDPDTRLVGWMPFLTEDVAPKSESNTYVAATMANQGIIASQNGTKNNEIVISGTVLSNMAPIDYQGASGLTSARSCLAYLRACGYVIYVRTPNLTSIGHISDISYPEAGVYAAKFADFKLTVSELWG